MTLLELLLIVVIIAIGAAIVIPNLLRSRIPPDESAAANNLRLIYTAQAAFCEANEKYAVTFDELATAESSFQEGEIYELKGGYRFLLSGTGDDFAAVAEPITGGSRCFFVDGSGIVRSNRDGPADATCMPIGDK